MVLRAPGFGLILPCYCIFLGNELVICRVTLVFFLFSLFPISLFPLRKINFESPTMFQKRKIQLKKFFLMGITLHINQIEAVISM